MARTNLFTSQDGVTVFFDAAAGLPGNGEVTVRHRYPQARTVAADFEVEFFYIEGANAQVLACYQIGTVRMVCPTLCEPREVVTDG